MKVRCINATGSEGRLTKGKTYTVINYDKIHITVCDDSNEYSTFTSWRFENIPANPAKLGLDVLDVTRNGIKHDSGKLKPTLLLDDMPLAIQEVLKVLKFGAEKYSEGNWLKVVNGINRYRNAADRHRLACAELDEESQLLHLAHEATSILMLLELKLRGKQ